MTTCHHPEPRLYTWRAFDESLCIACCDCGHVLKGAPTMETETFWYIVLTDPDNQSRTTRGVFSSESAAREFMTDRFPDDPTVTITTTAPEDERYGIRFTVTVPDVMEDGEVSGPFTYETAKQIAGAYAAYNPVIFDWAETDAS